jgi:hypothetical protein
LIAEGDDMLSRPRRIRWLLLVGLAQIGLTYLACEAFARSTTISWVGPCMPGSSGQYIFVGWPIIWSESQQDGEHVGLWLDPLEPIRTGIGPIRYTGSNYAVPVLLVLFALCLPLVVGDRLRRRRGPDGIRPSPSRFIRVTRAVLFGTVFGLTAAGLELETENHVFRSGHQGSTGWRAGGQFGPVYFLDRTINSYRRKRLPMTSPNGTPGFVILEPWIAGSTWYKEVHPRAIRFRYQLLGEPPYPAIGGEPPEPEEAWRLRTRLTWTLAGVGFLLGCLLFRPWRGASLS